MERPVEVVGIYVDEMTNTSVVLLGHSGTAVRLLPIHIGISEAQSIAIGLQHVEPPRPLSHDLILELMGLARMSISAVTVTALEGGTFLAELEVETDDSNAIVSARPSDAIALAVRQGIQIQVNDAVLDQAAVEVRPHNETPLSTEEIENVITKFEELLASTDSDEAQGPGAESPDPNGNSDEDVGL